MSTEVRHTVARSVTPLAWGVVLLVLGAVVREVAAYNLLRGGYDFEVAWVAVTWIGLLAVLVGLVLLVLGLVYLAGNVDYLAAREAARHRAEVRAASPAPAKEG